MTYDSISHEYGLPIRVGMRVRHRSTGLDGAVDDEYMRLPYKDCVRVCYDLLPDPVLTENVHDLIFLDAPVSAQLPDREVAA